MRNSRRWLLRDRTAGAHAAVDALVGGFDSRAAYMAYLRAVAAFRLPIERQLAALSWPAGLGDWRPSRVADAIARDMDDLGLAPPPAADAGLALRGDRLYGALYVLEGSALGARVLLQRAAALGLGPDFGARHLALLGGSLVRWQGFLERLDAADPFDLDGAVEASLATFARARAAFETR